MSSEWPFGSPSGRATIREYDPAAGRLVRVLTPDPAVKFTRPRGLRFGPGGELYCVGRDHVVAFDFPTGKFLGVTAELRKLNGQAGPAAGVAAAPSSVRTAQPAYASGYSSQGGSRGY